MSLTFDKHFGYICRFFLTPFDGEEEVGKSDEGNYLGRLNPGGVERGADVFAVIGMAVVEVVEEEVRNPQGRRLG